MDTLIYVYIHAVFAIQVRDMICRVDVGEYNYMYSLSYSDKASKWQTSQNVV